MLNSSQKSRIAAVFNSNPATKGCLIQYQGLCRRYPETIFTGDRGSRNYNERVVMVEEVLADPRMLAADPNFITNESAIRRELVGAGLSCGFFGLSVAGVAGGAAAAAPTGGASTVVVVLAWTGVVTGGAQCLNGVVRVLEASTRPWDNSLQRWDATEWYTNLVFWIDVAGVASGLGQMAAGLSSKKLWDVLSRQPTFASRKLTREGLKQMTSAERARVMRELMQEAEKTAEGRAAIQAALDEVHPGKGFVNNYSSSGLTGTRAAQLLPRVQAAADHSELILLQIQIRNEFVQILKENARQTVRDNLATPVSMALNGLPSDYVGSASGSVNYLIHCIGNSMLN